MPSSDFKRLVHNLLEADPLRDSLNDRFQITAKRTGLEKLFGRVIHFLTFRLLAKNSQLDLAARKAASCTEEIFKEPVTVEEQKRLVRAFSNFVDILARNDGSEGNRIRSVIARIEAMRPVREADKGAIGQAAPQQLLKPLVIQRTPQPPVHFQPVPGNMQPALPSPAQVPCAAAPVPQQHVQAPAAANPVAKVLAPVAANPVAKVLAPAARPPVQAAPPQPKLESNPDIVLQALFAAKDQAAFNTIILPYGGSPQADLLFKTILEKLSKSWYTAKNNPLLMLMAVPLRPEQAKLLIDRLMNFHVGMLSSNFERLHPSNRCLSAEQVFELVKIMSPLDGWSMWDDFDIPVWEHALNMYAAFLGTYPSIPKIFEQPRNIIDALFDTGNREFQAQVAHALVLRNHLKTKDGLDPDSLGKFYKATSDVWAKAADKFPIEIDFKDSYDLFEDYLPANNFAAFVNSFAAKPSGPKDSRASCLSWLFNIMVRRANQSDNVAHILSLTPKAFSFIDLGSSAYKLDLLEVLHDPSDPLQKKLICDLVRLIIRTNSDPLPKLLRTLSGAQIEHLPLSEYPRLHAFLFTLKLGNQDEQLKKQCFKLDASETQQILEICHSIRPGLMELIDALFDQDVYSLAPLVQSLIIQALNLSIYTEKDWEKIPNKALTLIELDKIVSPSARQFVQRKRQQ